MSWALCGFTAVESNDSAVLVLLKAVLLSRQKQVESKAHFQAVPYIDKVGSDTLECPRFVAKQGSYKV